VLFWLIFVCFLSKKGLSHVSDVVGEVSSLLIYVLEARTCAGRDKGRLALMGSLFYAALINGGFAGC